jgi:hypothetical protein
MEQKKMAVPTMSSNPIKIVGGPTLGCRHHVIIDDAVRIFRARGFGISLGFYLATILYQNSTNHSLKERINCNFENIILISPIGHNLKLHLNLCISVSLQKDEHEYPPI